MQTIDEDISARFLPQLRGSIRKGDYIRARMGHLTDIRRRSHRTNVAFVESLLSVFGHTLKTRRNDGDVASVGLITTVSPRVGTGLRGGSQTHPQILLHMFEWTINSHGK